MHSKRLSIFICVMMIVALVAPAFTVNADTTSGYITIDSSGRITKCSQEAEGDIIVPSKIGNYTVRGVQASAFKNCKKIESITLPNTISYIANNAFENCSSLKEVFVPESVNYINQGAFLGCTSLEVLTLPFIGQYSPQSANYNKYTFLCWLFGRITYSDNAQYVPASLKKVIITKPCTKIEANAFYGCSGIEEIVIPDSVTSIGDQAFAYTGLTSIDIPSSVGTIPRMAFYGCENLNTVNIADGVENIYSEPFGNCSALKSIYIPKSVKLIYSGAFSNCVSLESINVSAENVNYTSDDGVLFDEAKTILHSYPCGKNGSYTVPDGVTQIFGSAFYKNDGLTAAQLPDTITEIGIMAFWGCTSLKDIVMPKSVASVGISAFRECSALESIVFEDSPADIGDYAFYSCYNVEKIDLGNSIKSVGNNSFNLNTFNFPAKKVKELMLPDSIETIGQNSFSVGSNLERLTIGKGIKAIQTSFGGNIKYLNIRDMATWCDIDFSYNVNPLINAGTLHLNGEPVKDLEIPEGVAKIKYSVFTGLKAVDNIMLPSTLTSIEAVNFDDCAINENVFFNGSKEDWASVTVASYNSKLNAANFVFAECNCGNTEWIWNESVKPTYKDKGKAIGTCSVCREEQSKILSHTGIVTVGDINGDEDINVSDLTELRKLLLFGTENGLIVDAADANGNNGIDILDLIRLKKYLAKSNVVLG